jgi:HlyD family secretion protein
LDSNKQFTAREQRVVYNHELQNTVIDWFLMKKTIYIVAGVVGVLAISAMLFLVFKPKSPATTLKNDTETTQIDSGTVSKIVGATGTVSSEQSAILVWKTSGIVSEMYFQVGDLVQAGDILAVLDPGSLSPVEILAKADLVVAEKALDNLLESHTQAARALQEVEAAQEVLDEARSPDINQAAAFQAIAEADKAVADAERKLKTLTSPVSQDALAQAQANLVLLEKKVNDNQAMIDRIQKKLDKRDDQYQPWESRRRYKQFMEGLEFQRIQLQIKYENAVQKYENLQLPPNPIDVALAKADLLEAQAQQYEAQKQWERIKDGTSPADLALLEAQLADAQREWQRVQDGPTVEDISMAQARVTAAQATLDKARIVAPFDGSITEVISKPNDQVAPGTPAFRLDDLSSLWVDVGVSEIDINRVAVGQPVILSFDAILAKEYNGQVVEVAPVGSSNQGIVDFKVRVEINDADADVRPGMTAAVEIIVEGTDEEVFFTPNRSEGAMSLYYQDDQDGNLE